jgi:hypothetical protein
MASQLAVTQQPPSTITAGKSYTLIVTAEDPNGHVDSSYDGTVSLTLPSGGGTATAAAIDGVARFTFLGDFVVGSGYKVQATASGLASATSSPFKVVSAAVSQLIIEVQPPASVTAGAAFSLTVWAEDLYGNLVTSFSGSLTIALDDNPGDTTLDGKLTVTASKGVARFSSLTLDKVDRGYTLQATSRNLTAALTGSISVTAAAAAKLVVTTEPPSSVVAGSDFGFTATVEDKYGNVVTNYNGSVTVALGKNPGGSTLGGTLTVTVVNGLATFTDLTLNNPGTGYTLTVSATGLTGTTSKAFNVT